MKPARLSRFFVLDEPMRIYLLAVAICLATAIAGSYTGAAHALHWPLSGKNAIGAVILGATFFGVPGSAVTIPFMTLVKAKIQVLNLCFWRRLDGPNQQCAHLRLRFNVRCLLNLGLLVRKK